jgi:RNA polymerase sigma-70 factor, ECF subfamily
MAPSKDRGGTELERFRSYLHWLAEARVDRRLRGKLDPSDAVQQTLLQAYQAWSQYRGTTDAELASWLRRILARTLIHSVRDFHRARRDVARERSLDARIAESSARLEKWLADEESSPSRRAERLEETLRAAAVVQDLPQAQREAVVLYYWQGCTLAEIAEQLGRSRAAVAGLLRRGLDKLRESMARSDSQ